MPSYQLYRVREDQSTIVFTANPNSFGPHRLFQNLSQHYEQDQFKICLLRNVYLIYVDRSTHEASLLNDTSKAAASNDRITKHGTPKRSGLSPCAEQLVKQDVESRLNDLKRAAQILREDGQSLRH
jgi:hypothetical protein